MGLKLREWQKKRDPIACLNESRRSSGGRHALNLQGKTKVQPQKNP